MEELRGLTDNGTFKIVDSDSIEGTTYIFGSRFVDSIRRANISVRYKCGLVALNYGDEQSVSTATKARAVQRFTQRLLLSLAPSLDSSSSHTRDITQAYIPSTTSPERKLYIRPPAEMRLPPKKVLQAAKPLYEIPGFGLHWYLTYVNHQVSKLGMVRSRANPCLLYRQDEEKLVAMVILQVDDSFVVGSDNFLDIDEKESKSFMSKPRKSLHLKPTNFNGVEMSLQSDEIICNMQKEKIRKLNIPRTEERFKSQKILSKTHWSQLQTRRLRRRSTCCTRERSNPQSRTYIFKKC